MVWNEMMLIERWWGKKLDYVSSMNSSRIGVEAILSLNIPLPIDHTM